MPHCVDIETNSLGMCPASLVERLENIAERRDDISVNRESVQRIAAVLPVHIFGNPAQVDELRAVCNAWGVPMVEDAAEALASWRHGTNCGLFGAMCTLSFNGNKLIYWRRWSPANQRIYPRKASPPPLKHHKTT